MSFKQIVEQGSVIPVVTFTSIKQAKPLLNAFQTGGIKLIEITLRSEFGLPSIAECREAFPDMTIGAGSVKTPDDLKSALNAGAQFIVSPGTTQCLIEEARRWDIPFLPGVTTPGEILSALESGYKYQKLFPVDSMGGISYLKSLSAPLPEATFCPSGGVNATNYLEYLDLPNVACVSGSWLAPLSLIENGKWLEISSRAREAVVDFPEDRFTNSTNKTQ